MFYLLAAAAAQHAGCVNFGLTARRANILDELKISCILTTRIAHLSRAAAMRRRRRWRWSSPDAGSARPLNSTQRKLWWTCRRLDDAAAVVEPPPAAVA